MKYFLRTWLVLAAFCTTATGSWAQDSTLAAAEWQFSALPLSNGVYRLTATATLREGWGVFSLQMPDDLPNTRLQLDTASGAELKSLSDSPSPITEKNAALEATVRYFRHTMTLTASVQVPAGASQFRGQVVYMAFRGDEFTNPITVPFRFQLTPSGEARLQSSEGIASDSLSAAIRRPALDGARPVQDCGGTGAEGPESLWRIFILGILGGLLGLIMPCTFPMIPMTVSFFTKKAADPGRGVRNAFLYGFFIFLIYVLLSIPFYFLESGNQDILNNISTNAWLNLFFALIFLVFALSFFGLFEIGLPSAIANKADARSGLTSIGGIFFMALTLAIVSFSCTGPILGTLLVGALNEEGGAVQLTVAMAGFGLALGLPFGLFALFPRWLNSLPRSGSWMTTVKIVFAFIELALMIKFLSNADLVMHWGLLKREVFLGIWILIGLATSLYLFGILRFHHDPTPARLSRARIMTAILFLIFTIYLVPGLTNTRYANLSLVSGFPPPLGYSIYGQESAKEKGVEAQVVNDYPKALELARSTDKPLLLDFTGWACVNCRKMEENVWPREQVKKLIEERFILVSLYVDDREELPEPFVYILNDGSRKKIRTIGDFYATFQAENFQNASQPLYVIISPDERLLNRPVGYTPDVADYTAWLQCGLDGLSR